ncbi:MAG: efflux RND transporter periplasmic adaptor subunit [bacterium]
MSRSRVVVIVGSVAVAALALWLWRRSAQAPEVRFARATVERLVSALITNGKVEPYQWWPVRAARPGVIDRVAVASGARVAPGATIATLDSAEARAAVASAEAALAAAQAELATLEQGGAASVQTEIRNALSRARLDLANAEREHDSLARLEKRQAATRQQVIEAAQRVDQLKEEIAALERKQAALVDGPDLRAAQARAGQARAALEQARIGLANTRITSPAAGVVFDLPARPGAYVNAGDLVAAVGMLDRLRVRVYVDEPELGRVREGMPVKITWDALPQREWQGSVETMPTQVAPLGTRQVGEVVVAIENDGLALLPGTNINAEIQTEVVENAITVPKEAVRTDTAGQSGVFLLRGDHVEWRPVRLGASSVTRVAVLDGLAPGDLVALLTEQPLESGALVRPVLP